MLKCFVLLVSFYGDSYIKVPMMDASSETDLRLHFRTAQSNGLLLLAAGDIDYCLVVLQNGAIHVRLDLGSGDAQLTTPPGVVFNDLHWHAVRLARTEARVTLTVDGIYTTSAVTPGRFFELNIDDDVYMGGPTGLDDTARLFHHGVHHLRPFRGCAQNVTFNGVDVLRLAAAAAEERRTSNGGGYGVHAVTWDCSLEFAATSDQPISFLGNASYVAFPSLAARHDGRMTFDLRTRSASALVLYNSGAQFDSDFIAVEIDDGGRLKLRVNKGSGAVTLTSATAVDDGAWHQVEIFLDAVTARLTVDGARGEERMNFGSTRMLDVTTSLYVGGVGLPARSVAVQKELDSLRGDRAAAGSLIGCVQNFKVDGRPLGFREALVTCDVRPECV